MGLLRSKKVIVVVHDVKKKEPTTKNPILISDTYPTTTKESTTKNPIPIPPTYSTTVKKSYDDDVIVVPNPVYPADIPSPPPTATPMVLMEDWFDVLVQSPFEDLMDIVCNFRFDNEEMGFLSHVGGYNVSCEGGNRASPATLEQEEKQEDPASTDPYYVDLGHGNTSDYHESINGGQQRKKSISFGSASSLASSSAGGSSTCSGRRPVSILRNKRKGPVKASPQQTIATTTIPPTTAEKEPEAVLATNKKSKPASCSAIKSILGNIKRKRRLAEF